MTTVTLALGQGLQAFDEATVQVESTSQEFARTFEPDDDFAVDVLTGANQRFIFTATSGDAAIPVYQGEDTVDVFGPMTVTIKVQEMGRVQGRVYRTDTNASVANVALTFSGQDPYAGSPTQTLFSDANGNFIKDLPADDYNVTATVEGNLTVPSGLSISVPVGQLQNVDIAMEPPTVTPTIVTLTVIANGLGAEGVVVKDSLSDWTETLTNNDPVTVEKAVGDIVDFVIAAQPTDSFCTMNRGSFDVVREANVSVLCAGAVTCPYGADGTCLWARYVDEGGDPCSAANAERYTDCIHVAERLEVSLIGAYADCEPVLSAIDTLDALAWACKDTPDGPIVRSQELNDKRLDQLFEKQDSYAWLPNSVTIVATNGSRTSMTGTWWDNTFQLRNTPNTRPTLTAPYEINVVEGANKGITISGDSVVLVIPDSLGLNVTGVGAGDPIIDITANSRFTWFEGSLTRDNTGPLIRARDTTFTVLRRLDLTSPSDAIDLNGTRASLLSQLTLTGSGTGTGIRLQQSTYNTLANVTVDNFTTGIHVTSTATDNELGTITATRGSSGVGLLVEGNFTYIKGAVVAGNIGGTGLAVAEASEVSRVVVRDITSYGNGVGMRLGKAADTVAASLTIFNNDQGLIVSEGRSVVVFGATVANSATDNVQVVNTADAYLLSTAALNGAVGIDINESTAHLLNVASLDNDTNIQMVGTTNVVRPYGSLTLGGPGTDCSGASTSASAPPLPGAMSATSAGDCNVTFVDSNVSPRQVLGSAELLFVGAISTEQETVNGAVTAWGSVQETGGRVAAKGVAGFENRFRGWILDDGSVRGAPTWDDTQMLRVFDWRLVEDSNRTLYHALATATNSVTSPTSFAIEWSGTNCDAYEGSTLAGGRCQTTLLPVAIVIDAGGAGMPLLCEPDEECVFWPSIGGYQGEDVVGDKQLTPLGDSNYSIGQYDDEFAPN